MLSITESDAEGIGELNPIRYRGYYYDSETGFYYLSSRYYDPETGRFINADDEDVLTVEQDSLLQFNLFSYCLNNPVNRYDDTGNISWSIFAKGVGLIADGITAIAVGVAVISCGVAAPVMLGVAAVTIAAGALTTINGMSDIGEAVTGQNVIRDSVFQGNSSAYNIYSAATATLATTGATICGKWTATNVTKIADHKLQQIIDKPERISKYSTRKFQKIAKKSSWTSKVSRNGKGFRVFKGGNSIRYNMNGSRFDAKHFWGKPYWVISSPFSGKVRVRF